MTQTPILTPANDETDPSAERAERHMRLLAELAEIGMDLAREVRRQCAALSQPRLVDDTAAAPPSLVELALAYSRLSRAVRQTLALEVRIEADERARAVGIVVEHQARQADAAQAWEDRENRIEGVVTKIIRAEAADDSGAERLLDEMCEHLEDEDVYEDYSHRPTGEIIALICKDLGLTPDWSRWEDRDWAADAARTMASGPGRPLSQPPDGACQLPRFTGEQKAAFSSHAARSGAGEVDSRSEDGGGAPPRHPPPLN
jgi:hypothetical protein